MLASARGAAASACYRMSERSTPSRPRRAQTASTLEIYARRHIQKPEQHVVEAAEIQPKLRNVG